MVVAKDQRITELEAERDSLKDEVECGNRVIQAFIMKFANEHPETIAEVPKHAIRIGNIVEAAKEWHLAGKEVIKICGQFGPNSEEAWAALKREEDMEVKLSAAVTVLTEGDK